MGLRLYGTGGGRRRRADINRYVGNDPANKVDPSGLDDKDFNPENVLRIARLLIGLNENEKFAQAVITWWYLMTMEEALCHSSKVRKLLIDWRFVK